MMKFIQRPEDYILKEKGRVRKLEIIALEYFPPFLIPKEILALSNRKFSQFSALLKR